MRLNSPVAEENQSTKKPLALDIVHKWYIYSSFANTFNKWVRTFTCLDLKPRHVFVYKYISAKK